MQEGSVWSKFQWYR